MFRNKNRQVKWQPPYAKYHLIPSFLTQLLIYLTTLLLYFQAEIWIQVNIDSCIRVTFQGLGMYLGMQKEKEKSY